MTEALSEDMTREAEPKTTAVVAVKACPRHEAEGASRRVEAEGPEAAGAGEAGAEAEDDPAIPIYSVF